jgi:Holliday junction resolvasome RuvABC endonuclease subunit
MIVIGIDPGIKNLGWSVYDTEKCHFLSFGRYDLTKDQPKNKHTKYADLVKDFIDASKDVFAMADAVAIEMQMMARFKVIETAFQCFFYEKAHRVSMRSVRCHFDISTKKYSTNKKASIEIVPSLQISSQNKRWFASFDKKKRDDVADAMLLALYWTQVKAPGAKPKRKKRKASSSSRGTAKKRKGVFNEDK